jgi:choice-of-anchor A domain-containing protein
LSAGPATLVNGNLVGNVAHGDTCQFDFYVAVPPYPRLCGCEFPNYTPESFQSGGQFCVGDAYTNILSPLSNAFLNTDIFPQTGLYSLDNDVLTLYGSNTAFQVFSVNAADLANTRLVNSRGLSSASTIIINVVGSTKVSISSCGLQSLLPFSRILIWNAPAATSFTIKNVALPGYILAPSASIVNPVGQILGGAHCGSFSAAGQIDLSWQGPFAGCIPNDLTPPTCAACAAGYYRQDSSCTCYPVVTISATITDNFGFNTGYAVKYTINNAHSKPVSAVTVQFPTTNTACPLQVVNAATQVFGVTAVTGATLQYTTPTWTGFAADGYNFIAVFQSAAATCNPAAPIVPVIVSASY